MKIGDTGRVRWTSAGRQYEGPARISKVNVKTLRCTLLADVPVEGSNVPYQEGRDIIVPVNGTEGNRFIPQES